jgi:hypothetical protein
MSTDRPDVLSEQMLRRICAEYVEMPGLRLSRKQAQRPWGGDEEACVQILEFLVKTRFLKLFGPDTYERMTDGPVVFPRLRAAKAQLRPSAAPARKEAGWNASREGQRPAERPWSKEALWREVISKSEE